jgi:hypothetical protein
MMVQGREYGVRRFVLKFFFIISTLFFSQKNFAQHTILLNQDVNQQLELGCNNLDVHSSVKPMLDVDVNGKTFKILDSITHSAGSDYEVTGKYYTAYTLNYPRATFRNYYRKPTDTSSFSPGGKAALLIRPVYDVNVGYDLTSNRLLTTTVGGAILDADYKQKIGIEIRFAGGNVTLPDFLDSIVTASHTMPGYGDRAYSIGKASYTFQHISGNLIWRPSKIFNLQIGRDKHFWGDGYRSLFLSDGSAAMPYIKQTTTIWKFQYVSLFTWMQDYTVSQNSVKNFRNKFGTFHYISFNAAKWWNIGVFESVIWQGNDSHRVRGFDPDYLNPVIFFRPVEYSLGSSDNAMLGFASKFRLNRNNQVYFQLLLDEFYLKEILAHNQWWANKQGFQLGYKCFNFADVKNLFLQTEMNVVRPFTYSHGSPQQNYSNAGNPLAHPLGSNFFEWLGLVSYTHQNYIFSGKFVSAIYGLDPDGLNFGQNINKSYMTHDHDYDNKMFQGIRTNLINVELKAAYKFNTAFPLQMEFIFGARHEHNVYKVKDDFYVQFGLSLPLWRSYRDY